MILSKLMHRNVRNSKHDEDVPPYLKDEIRLLRKNIQTLEKDVRFRSSYLVTLSIVTVAIVGLFVFAGVILPQILGHNTSGQTNNLSQEMRSSYVIQNLKGDKINTWISWKLVPTDVFHIHVMQSDQVTEARMKIIHDVVFSEEKLEIDNTELHKDVPGKTTFYKGWEGALKEANLVGTKFPVPISLHSQITELGEGNVIIKLTNLKNPDGFAGYTTSIVDETNHQILKSEVTIYDVDNLGNENFEKVVRHELGHAFGLAHSTDPDDLMYDILITAHPFISECDISAIEGLYNGTEKGEVICQA